MPNIEHKDEPKDQPKDQHKDVTQWEFKKFNSNWEHVVDPAKVHGILASVGIPHPERYNQLMVANDINGTAYYAIYASGGHKDKAGAPVHDAGTPFDKLYDRGDLLDTFKS